MVCNHEPELRCPHCERELEKVWYRVLQGWEDWIIVGKTLLYDDCETEEKEGPFCDECDGPVSEYLEQMEIG